MKISKELLDEMNFIDCAVDSEQDLFDKIIKSDNGSVTLVHISFDKAIENSDLFNLALVRFSKERDIQVVPIDTLANTEENLIEKIDHIVSLFNTSLNEMCNTCPFNFFSEESAQVQNYGCLPTTNEIVRLKKDEGHNWACHCNEEKICTGLQLYNKRNNLGLDFSTGDLVKDTELFANRDKYFKWYGK